MICYKVVTKWKKSCIVHRGRSDGRNIQMAKDFFIATQETVLKLNANEREIFDYVVKNMNQVKRMSIQKFAAAQFVSTTSIFRFAQKLGFKGYADFINSLLVTTHSKSDVAIPEVIVGGNYSEAYLKNAIEAVRVMSPTVAEAVIKRLGQNPQVYILCDDNTHGIGQYCEKLLIGLGFRAYFPEAAYQRQTLVDHITSRDMIIALSYSGEDAQLVDFIERVYLKERPFLLSVTRADNNILESLSDANFYVFAEEIRMHGMDLTSSVPMLMILELLAYQYVKSRSEGGGGLRNGDVLS